MSLLEQEVSSIKLITYGSFKTIPNSLRQLPNKNLIIPEAPSYWVEAKIDLFQRTNY